MKSTRCVSIIALLFCLNNLVVAAQSGAQKDEDAAINSFLSTQKSGGEDAQSVGSEIADLDGDGNSELVLLWVLLGPTYWRHTLTVFSKTAAGYKPVASLTLQGMATKLSSVKAGIIVVDHELFAKNDPRCCPSIKKQLRYRWLDKKISEVKTRATRK